MFLAVLQAAFGLIVTLGLIGLAAYAARRWGPNGMFQMKPLSERRLGIIESLTLDPSHRLVLVRMDQEERLLLLGEGRMLGDGRPLSPSSSSSSRPSIRV